MAVIGVIGLAVMGENLALNLAGHGFPVVVYNRTAERTRRFLAERAQGFPIHGAYTLAEFVQALERPRRILLMVQAGAPVDEVLAQIEPLLAPGDIVLDGGNSHYRDTERRASALAGRGLHYFGVGISGGEEGALKGPAIMVGGPAGVYPQIASMLEAIAARTEDGPCCGYLGPGGAGHYVKMVHNGIEYGIMELIAEVYHLLRVVRGLSASDLSALFAAWNAGPLNSYLVEITARILAYIDPETGQPLVDLILDKAGQKGTGRWTSQDALDLGVPVPTIDAALWARHLSAYKSEREQAARLLPAPPAPATVDGRLVGDLHDALYAGMITAFAQGFALLHQASREYQYQIPLAEVARIWQGGCIIRARLLKTIRASFLDQPDRPNLLLDPRFAELLAPLQTGWRRAVITAREWGLPCPALSASLDYYDAYRQARLPANLVQAQRDYFGAHTYERIDRPGVFHTQWTPEDPV
jgi:6-phosphogluconate dehydrogenase